MPSTTLVTDQLQINRLLVSAGYIAHGYVSGKALGAIYQLATEDTPANEQVILSFRIDMTSLRQEVVGFVTLGEAKAYAEAASHWAGLETQPYAFLAYALCHQAKWDRITSSA